MGPGLQLLAITSAVDLASQVGSLARGAVGNFADLVTPHASDVASESTATPSDSSADQLNRIHAALADHLQRLGLSEQTPFQIEVQVDGELRIQADHAERLGIEDAILRDDALVAEIRQYAQRQSTPSESYFVHWPPLEQAEMFRG
ncbi:hypothetical protein EC9_07580 [Rosistilla ulvae]|uniref:Uncharacterized protein n=1 Tax=Rosistilla ulvae TaxID=1930277 RepID=A0A517LVE5_9BACT|nr:hypothetical protein [Rosistilla ulvae]QDS86591.1 hypothetical protein EC9_07580 [Rosistilla ulvae]